MLSETVRTLASLPSYVYLLLKSLQTLGWFSSNLVQPRPSRPEVTGGTTGSVEFKSVNSHSFASLVACVRRKLSPAFLQALLSFCRMCSDSRLGAEVSALE